MSQITINDVILKFKDSSFTGDQWEQVASWVINGGGEAAAESARIALAKAVEAVNAATNANRDANRAESYAVGGTGTREGEDTDNAKYYCEQTRRISGGEFIVSINGEGADETGNFTLNATKVGAIDASEKGAVGGVAELDGAGKVPAAQLPAAMTPAAHAATHKQGGSDPLAAADFGAVPALFSGRYRIANGTDDELKAVLTEVYESMQDGSIKFIDISFSTPHPVLGGGTYSVKLSRLGPLYGVAELSTYGGNAHGRILVRSWYNGQWQDLRLLADIETGTWTPVFSDNSLAKLRDGIARYCQIGDIVYVEVRVEILASSDATFSFSGLPYPPKFDTHGHFETKAAVSSATIKVRTGHVLVTSSGNVRPVYIESLDSGWYIPVSAFGVGNVLDITFSYHRES